MQQNRARTAVTSMELGEIIVYRLYVAEGLRRGRLPYTANFDRIVRQYNAQMNTNETHSYVWRLLENVLKGGEEKIEAFLHQQPTAIAG